jgi:hypothetical protein
LNPNATPTCNRENNSPEPRVVVLGVSLLSLSFSIGK